MNNERWLLPEGIDELLPAQAHRVEQLRRRLLDLFHTWGYQLIIPPFVEYTESLLTGVGRDLDLQTFKLIDQHNGRMMGVRADMTPQAARIDAHRLGHEYPERLCYLGTVLRTRADDFSNARSILQIGAELFGHGGIESDVEILSLMLTMLQNTGISKIYLDLGHVGVFSGLSRQAGLSREQHDQLFDTLQRKAAPEIENLLATADMPKAVRTMLAQLIWLNGGLQDLEETRQRLSDASDEVQSALDMLIAIAAQITDRFPQVEVHYDLAEVRGLHYHTGLVFSAYQLGVGQAIAQGGRYDEIGKVFGRSRPATGFSADLRQLIALSPISTVARRGIFAPYSNEQALRDKITGLRNDGERVICALPEQQGSAREMGCDRELASQAGEWIIRELGES